MTQDLQTRPGRHSRSITRTLVAGGVAIALGVLVFHATRYWFLTDDAFISFRYARNLSQGDGLVFNPGLERVEGYSNFLWVLLLAVGAAVGASPELLAPLLSMLATVVLWGGVVAFAARWADDTQKPWILVPAFLLAATRSFAVWSTSGLETRLFELLVLAGALRLTDELGRVRAGETSVRPWAALWFALATLTRPDGLLIALCVAAAVALHERSRLANHLRWVVRSTVVFASLVGGHYLFRFLYYGEWLPNTYYVKVDGRTWWGMGSQYLESFVLEYAIYLWVPFLIAAVLYHRRRRTLYVPLIFAAVIGPHVFYIASIGGDHFEFRPLDLYFPLLYLMIFFGVLYLARGFRARVLVAAGLVVVTIGVVELPLRSHLEFDGSYAAGFPGRFVGSRQSAREFLDPRRGWLFRLPGLRSIAERHRMRIQSTTRHFVGIRQEEHALFLDSAVAEARSLSRLIERGVLPADTRVAIDCVGAIPYHTDLTVIDRLGLTDATVARSEFINPEVMAHGKYATRQYTQERGVDLWAADHVRLLWDRDDPGLLRALSRLYGKEMKRHFADVGDGKVLLVWLPQGLDDARIRFPSIEFRSTHDEAAIQQIADGLGR